MRSFSKEKKLLPEYPVTPHLPWKCTGLGVQATHGECSMLWTSPYVCVQEKIDGSSCGMTLGPEGHPVIRNRDHILTKGYLKDTPAKMQFRPVFNWFYEHKKMFSALVEQGPYSVYGDWMYMAHGMKYDLLPSLFMTYDVYNHEKEQFLESKQSQSILVECGFSFINCIHFGPLDSWLQIEEMANDLTSYADNTQREGVYVKVSNGDWITHRFKMVRPGFVQGALFSDNIIRNTLSK